MGVGELSNAANAKVTPRGRKKSLITEPSHAPTRMAYIPAVYRHDVITNALHSDTEASPWPNHRGC
jgi:hypothetical protein